MRKFASFLLSLLVVVCLATPAAAAEGSVAYEGKKKISITPATEIYTDSDLFGAFKGVMPGDTLKEQIKIYNYAVDCDYVKVYLKAIPHNTSTNPLSASVASEETVESMTDFLKQLEMTVKNGSKTIFDGAPSNVGDLKNSVYLGSLRRLRSMTLDVELQIPITLGNEYADREGEVDWVFYFEAHEDSTPKTGDSIMTAVIVMVGAGAALILMMIIGKKKKA